jgi:hypothetical protein
MRSFTFKLVERENHLCVVHIVNCVFFFQFILAEEHYQLKGVLDRIAWKAYTRSRKFWEMLIGALLASKYSAFHI